ncbi:MAG: hypothetical protein JWQ25_1334 [Daejeonella sp.]|nr:hypothetical protein [Daejeonella sp.]
MNNFAHPFKLVFYTFFLCIAISCKKGNITTEVYFPINDYISDNYLDGAQELYIREIKNNPLHPNYNEANLDTAEINRTLRKLQLVYELKTPQSDSVFKILRNKPLKCHSLNSIVLQVNTTQPHIQKLAASIIPTGNATLDNLLLTYKFTGVQKSYNYPGANYLSINSTESYNLIPIISKLKTVPGVTSAENNGVCFDGSNLEIKKTGSKTIIDFSVGSGDCPAGCIYRKHWLFSVENNKAKFEGWK